MVNQQGSLHIHGPSEKFVVQRGNHASCSRAAGALSYCVFGYMPWLGWIQGQGKSKPNYGMHTHTGAARV
jgi:hypothetical protein